MSLIIAGLDWAPFHASWKLQPNVWFYNYTDEPVQRGRDGKTDVVFNLTFFLSF